MRILPALVVALAVANGQKPVIAPGGVVNSASYFAGGPTGRGVTPGSIVSIFGNNLAVTTQSASGFPLPTTLAGTSVTLNEVPVRIIFASSTQLNVEFPYSLPPSYPPPYLGTQLVVSTPAGASDPYLIDTDTVFGIFTLDASGCGPGAVLNIAKDGGISTNSPLFSASPGDFIAVFGTGLGGVSNPPPPGSPALSDPLSRALTSPGAIFDLAPPLPTTPLRTNVSWAGRAPGFAGVDQVNVRVPDQVREGCAVPLSFATAGGNSRPVTVSIRKGGGPCTDPPVAGFAELTWEKVVSTGITPTGEKESFTATFPASPGKQQPPPVTLPEGVAVANVNEYFGPTCVIPGYRAFDAGVISIRGPGFGPLEVVPAPVDGQLVYSAALPKGAMRPGTFSISAIGGSDIGAFQSSVRIGSGIDITSPFPPGTVLSSREPIVVNWNGGDPNSWVTMRVERHIGARVNYSIVRVRASRGAITLGTVSGFLPPGPGPVDSEIIIEVTPDWDDVPAIAAPGLLLGGRHLWKYTYRFAGLTIL